LITEEHSQERDEPLENIELTLEEIIQIRIDSRAEPSIELKIYHG